MGATATSAKQARARQMALGRTRASGGGGSAAWGLLALRVLIGTFLFFEGAGKLGWLTDPGPLASQLNGWLSNAHPWGRWYVETIALPGVPVFARLVPLAEISAGIALVAGFWTRLAATVALVMVLNFHAASSLMFHYSFLTSGYGLPVLGSLLALAIGASRLPWSVHE